MKGITTIAALPSGAGQAAHLKPEVHSSLRLLPLHKANWHRNAYLFGSVPNFTFEINPRSILPLVRARSTVEAK